MDQSIASASRNVTSQDMVPIKSIVIPPSIEQRVRVGDANAVVSSFNEADFQELTHYAARMPLIETGVCG